MPFCPICRSEYLQGYTHCADCGEPLKEELAPICDSDAEYIDTELVLLCSIYDNLEAGMLIAALKEKGIPALLKNCSLPREYIYIIFRNMFNNEIYVSSHQESEAREILTGIFGPDADVHAIPFNKSYDCDENTGHLVGRILITTVAVGAFIILTILHYLNYI